MRRLLVLTVLLTMLAASALPAAADVEKDAVFNGGFELAAHQARPLVCEVFGEDGAINALDPDTDAPWLVIINPCHSSGLKAAGWSSGQTTGVEDDGTGNRVVRFIAGSDDPITGASHNLWQAYNQPHQAFSGDFDAYELTVLEGAVPSEARIQLSFSTSPANPHPFVVVFVECHLTFTGALLTPENGTISIDPTEGAFSSSYSGCDGLRDSWNHENATKADRQEILGSVRLVQNSFWSWNAGSDDVVIDDVSMRGSKLFVE